MLTHAHSIDQSPSPTTPARATSGPELAERARRLAPLLATHAPEAERRRRPLDAVIHALEEAEIFKLMVPACYGGLELDLDTFFEVGVALAEGDAAAAWVANFYVEHNWILCQFPESFQRELFAARSYVLAPAMVAPAGRAVREGDGYRLNGRWKWASGISHGDWVIPGALEMTSDGRPNPLWFALPAAEVKVEDTWYVSGMIGTGSSDVVVEDVYIPAERSVSMLDLGSGHGPGALLHDGPLYRTPMIPILTMAAAMPALGQARASVRRFRERLTERVLIETANRQAERPGAQMRLARLEVEVREAELLMRDAMEDVCARRNRATIEDRARWATQFAIAVDRCKKVIQGACEASGAHAHLQSSPLQRALRDVNALACHALFNLDNRFEGYGRVLLGMDPGPLATLL
ncbi:acyl-CoA dehydrogenase [Haliangium sp.]|uniref:acyl-CoA dehydrogenase n=1 Tax=Haliangium sp. TaxID=2663208 RepID=UPI003D14F51C